MTRVVAIVQARIRSTRLPGKALADVAGQPLLAHVIERASTIEGVDEVLVATSDAAGDAAILALARAAGVRGVAGSAEDVLDRYVTAARLAAADVIVRITADCPLLDPHVSATVLRRYGPDVDYVSNTNPPSFPDGLDTEVFSVAALERAWREVALPSEREHVTPYIWKHPELFRLANVSAERDLSSERWTVDEPEDLAFVRAVYERLHRPSRPPFRMADVLDLLEREPALRRLNSGFARNEGYARSLRGDPKPTEDERRNRWRRSRGR